MKTATQKDSLLLTIKGKEYTLAFGFQDLCDAEEIAHAKWGERNVNALTCIMHYPTRLFSILDMFALMLEKHHPDIPFRDRRRLVGIGSIVAVAVIVINAFTPPKSQASNRGR
jgi:hypothetical protein